MEKAKVFMIMPFKDDIAALYEHLKDVFCENYEFTNAGDLDNQQNILQDIVEGIYEAKVVIADLTGLNPNVFYELGLAHAMNKKVIILTQDIGELPFDIKSYRAVEYSLLFHRLPALLNELKKLLDGAISGDVKYGNPVSDYIPNFYAKEIIEVVATNGDCAVPPQEEESGDEEDAGGFFDYIAEISESSSVISGEITDMGTELTAMSSSVSQATGEIDRVKQQSGSADMVFVRNVCRKLAEPIEQCASKLKRHIEKITKYWDFVENSYLSLMDLPMIYTPRNLNELQNSKAALIGMKESMIATDLNVDNYISVLRKSIGMERRLNKALMALISELEAYLQMTNTMESSIDRIISKTDIVLDSVATDTI